MAKRVLTQEAAKTAEQEAAKTAEQETKAKAKKMSERIKTAFDNYPTADVLYHDGEELFFSPVKQGMTVVRRDEVVRS